MSRPKVALVKAEGIQGGTRSSWVVVLFATIKTWRLFEPR